MIADATTAATVAAPNPPTPGAATPRLANAFFSREQLDALGVAETVVATARVADNVAPLQAREISPQFVDDLNSDVIACRALVTTTTGQAGNRKTATKQEAAARKQLVIALHDVQAGARQKYAAIDPLALTAYHVGQALGDVSRIIMTQIVTDVQNRLQTDTLPGIGAPQKAAIQSAFAAWNAAHDAQGGAQSGSQTARGQVMQMLDGLPGAKQNGINARRRTIQFAADAVWPPSNAANAGIRRQFGLQPNRPFTG